MSSIPEPPRPPSPPPPPRVSSHALPIVLLLLALLVAVSIIAIWGGLRFLSRVVRVEVQGETARPKVSVKTPVGSFDFSKDVSAASLGLPLYPGAEPVRDDSATLRFSFPEEERVHVIVGKFETRDGLDKVKDFYRGRVGSQATRIVERDRDGKTVFEIKRDGEEKIVALKAIGSRTRIELVRVLERREETN